VSPLVWLLILPTLLSCESNSRLEPGPRLVCDPGNEGVFFGYSRWGAPNVTAGRAGLVENGLQFLFVGADCRFWAFRGALAPLGWWAPVVSGQLSAETVAALNDEFLSRPWPDGEISLLTDVFDSSVDRVWVSGRSTSVCASGCLAGSAELRSVIELSNAWLDELHEQGTPLHGPMRVATLRVDPEPGLPEIEWTGALDFAAAERSSETYGGRVLVENEEDVSILRREREIYATGARGSWYYQYLPMTQGGTFYRVYARDALPFEDDVGFFVFP
jgi:hypothetical protein